MSQGKKFAADFERIDEVKGNDKILIQDSTSGVVKYASPSQINAKFDQLVADIATAVQAVADAQAAQAAAEQAVLDATAQAVAAGSAKTEAVGAKGLAEAAQAAAEAAQAAAEQAVTDAAAVLANAIQKDGDEPAIIAAFIAALGSRIGAVENAIASGFSSLIVDNLTVRNSLSAFIMGGNFVLRGNAAPSVIPDFVGQEFIDETNKIAYKACGNNAVADWKQITQ